MAKLSKAERRSLVKDCDAAELFQSMPLSPKRLHSLLDCLDVKLEIYRRLSN